MKQTNNAIKFLMAQYRAIFKNANLKMFLAAATAAAALAATQAHAAGPINADAFAGLSGDQTATTGSEINIGRGDPIENGKEFTLTIEDANTHKIDGGNNTAKPPAEQAIVVTANKGTIVINKKQPGAGADPKLTVGAEKGATVTLAKLKVGEGELDLGGTGKKASSITANVIEIGGGSAADASKVSVGETSSLIASGEVGSISIGDNAKVEIAADAKIKGKTVTISNGKVNLAGAANAGSDLKFSTIQADDDLSITGGTISLAKDNGRLLGSTIKVEGANTAINNSGSLTIGSEATSSFTLTDGTIENKDNQKQVKIEANEVHLNGGKLITSGAASQITLKGEITTSGTKITNDGSKLIIIGSAHFKDDTLDVSKKSGSTVLSAGADETTTLTLSAKELGKVMQGGLNASGGGTGVVAIEGDTKINLASTGDGATSILQDTGALNSKLNVEAGSKLRVKGTTATFTKGNTINAGGKDFGLVFDTLTIGSGDNVALESGAALEVHSQLTVAKGESTSTLKVAKGSVTLNGDSGSVAAKLVNLEAGSTDKVSDATLTVQKGTWGVKGLTLTKGNAKVEGGATLNVGGDLAITEGSVELTNKATLNVTGKLSTAGANGKITADNSKINAYKGGDIALSGQGIELSNNASLYLDKEEVIKTADGKQVLNDSKFAKNAVSGAANTTIVIKDAKGQGLSMTSEEFDAFKKATGFTGLFEVNLTEFTGDAKPHEGMNIDNVVGNASTQAYKDIGVKVTDGSQEVSKNVSVGNVQIQNDKDLTLGTGGALTLSHPGAGNLFVSKSGSKGPEVASVTFNGTDNSLTLGGTGEIGSILVGTSQDAQGQLTIGSDSANGTVSVKGDIGAKEDKKALTQVIVNDKNTLNVSGSVYTAELDMKKGSAIDASGSIVVKGSASIMGNVKASTLDLSGKEATSHVIAGDSNLKLGTLKLADKNTLTIGQDKVEGEGGHASSSASVFADSLLLGGADSVVFIDPEYGKGAAILATQKLVKTTNPDQDTGEVDGSIFVGKNAAFGYGFDQADFEGVMSNYLDADGSFADPKKTKTGLANALVLNKPLTIKSGAGVLVDHELTSDKIPSKKATIANKLELGKNGGLVLTEGAFGGPDKNGVAITFGNATGANTVTAAEGASIKLVGNFTTQDKDLKFFSGNGLVLDGPLAVEAMGGLLSGTLVLKGTDSATLGDKGLQLVTGARDKLLHGVSTPIADMFLGMAEGKIFVNSKGAGFKFVTDTISPSGNFKAVDAAAHAATYAGAQQAAVAAVGTMAEAVGARVGSMGVEATIIPATGSQANGGVWVSPMYKSVDADGFGAEGATYGADVDLAGVAFGADTVNGNMRFGAVFNIGSGDADGKGNGNGLKDEFDYYGFGMYSVMGFGQFALVGDASLNVISHDVEGLGAKGSADTTAVTMGVTGQYTISSPAVDVTPHLGARFIRLDTDSYDLSHEEYGVVANTDFEVQNVFSIPLGITLSKAIEMGGWSLSPSADLTLTFNTGDTDAKSTTKFDGINKNIGLTTEVLDEVTYGVAVGLGAQYGAFGTHIGINYTGSENTDSFGVNAQARYMF